jgi:hypothetical protein
MEDKVLEALRRIAKDYTRITMVTESERLADYRISNVRAVVYAANRLAQGATNLAELVAERYGN